MITSFKVLLSIILMLLIVNLVQCTDRANLKIKLAKADATCQKRLDAHVAAFTKAIQQQQSKANSASARYEQQRAQIQQKSGVIRHEVVKIINRPVYRNVCFDTDGVSAVNAVIGAAASTE